MSQLITGRKPDRDTNGRFGPGNSANPNGRPKGSLNKMFLASAITGGVAAALYGTAWGFRARAVSCSLDGAPALVCRPPAWTMLGQT